MPLRSHPATFRHLSNARVPAKYMTGFICVVKASRSWLFFDVESDIGSFVNMWASALNPYGTLLHSSTSGCVHNVIGGPKTVWGSWPSTAIQETP